MGSEDTRSILLAGADRVGTTIIESREQIIQLCQIGAHSETQSVTAVPPLSPYNETLSPKVVA